MTSKATRDNLAKRRVPALISYLSPFCIVEKDDAPEPWSATIEQVNRQSWDYVALHEVIGGVDVGLKSPYHMVVARDGALALPPLPELRSDQAAVEFFNRCLAALLLGGVYCEAINLDGLDLGCVIDWKYVRSRESGTSGTSCFHQHIRFKNASTLDSIHLYKPRSVRIGALDTAMRIGLAAMMRLEPMRGEYLLKGATGLARRDWGSALANLWIVIEQLLEGLWTREIVEPTCALDSSKVRKEQLNDNRSWTAATRIEMLYQRGVFDLGTLKALSKARKARNDLAHRGVHPSESDANVSYAGLRSLICVVLANETLPLLGLDLANHAICDPFAPPKHNGPLEPEFWMPIPKLPGEEELEKEEATIIPEAPEILPSGKRHKPTKRRTTGSDHSKVKHDKPKALAT